VSQPHPPLCLALQPYLLRLPRQGRRLDAEWLRAIKEASSDYLGREVLGVNGLLENRQSRS
jgi:hypothetical protein